MYRDKKRSPFHRGFRRESTERFQQLRSWTSGKLDRTKDRNETGKSFKTEAKNVNMEKRAFKRELIHYIDDHKRNPQYVLVICPCMPFNE